jgi:hypothetical protein
MTDLTLGIRLTADGSGFVGQVKVARGELDKLAATGRQTTEASKRQAREALGLGDAYGRLRSQINLVRLAMLAVATGAGASLARSFIQAASTSEQYRVRLTVLLRDQREANLLFRDMNAYAARTPFEFEKVMGAATRLAAVLKGGREEIATFMPLIGDLAAAVGLGIEETTDQVARMLAGGAAAADQFRERGVLAMLGFESDVQYTAQQTREKLFREWQKADSQFRGATESLAKTWDGQVSMMADRWFQFRNQVMDAGPFEFLKAMMAEINDQLGGGDGQAALAREIGDAFVDMVKAIIVGTADLADFIAPVVDLGASAIARMLDQFNQLPPWVQEIGILGAVLGGRKAKLLLGGLLVTDAIADWLNKNVYDTTFELPGLIQEKLPIALGQGSILDAVGFGQGDRSYGNWARSFVSNAERRASSAPLEIEVSKERPPYIAPELRVFEEEKRSRAHARVMEAMDAHDALPKLFSESKQLIDQWRRDALASLDATTIGYEFFAQKVEEVYTSRLTEAYDTSLRQSREWSDGVIRGLRDYAREAGDAAANFEHVTRTSFAAGEDAFVKFAKTGKLEISDLFNTIADEVLRAYYRMQIAGPVAEFLQGLDFRSMLGFRAGGVGRAPSGVDLYMPPTGTNAAVAHGGGHLTDDNFAMRRVPDWIFHNAPRHHAGWIAPGERPAILRHDESVLTPGQMRALGGAARPVVINIHNSSGAPVRAQERPGSGGAEVDVYIGEVVARNIRLGGAVAQAFEDSYGQARRGSVR